jgi:hypothetical protein
MEKSLVRSSRCPDCGAEMLWTQNAWKTGDTGQAAYCCENGHVVDPSLTPQCPGCGIHDTVLVSAGSRDPGSGIRDPESAIHADGARQQFRCTRCEERFEVPR